MMASILLKSAICILLTLALFTSRAHSDSFDTFALKTFEGWVTKYGRVYKNLEERTKRFTIFKENLQSIEAFNQGGNMTYALRLNEFSDLTNKEFLGKYTGYYKTLADNGTSPFEPKGEVPYSVNWVERGAVSRVQNQAACGSCWAFSAIGAVEGITQIKKGTLYDLSEQQLVDCSTNFGNHGCNGGNAYNAFNYIMYNNGITSESNYPYSATDGICNTTAASNVVAQISGYIALPWSETILRVAVAMQPVSIVLDASGTAFQQYGGEIYTGPCGHNLNHLVLVVGYGTERGSKYWLIKNSWGTSWGEGGYMKILRDSGYWGGLCGLALAASFPIA